MAGYVCGLKKVVIYCAPVFMTIERKVEMNLKAIKYKVFGRYSKGLMAPGDLCHVEDPAFEQTHEDVLHPCVRFVENGFEGHTWWMTYTPCYDTPAFENPVLCYADGPGSKPPTDWHYYCSIVGSPETGYNSDPTLFFRDGKCFVHWREYRTPRAKALGCYEVTSGTVVANRAVRFNEAPQLVEDIENQDREISPTFISLDGVPRAYAMHIRLKKRKNPPTGIRRLVGKIPGFLQRFGLCLPKRCRGVAIWDGPSLTGPFTYSKTLPFKNVSRLYDPWHMDLFVAPDKTGTRRLYAVVLTSDYEGDICLASSDDGERFRFFRKPLLTPQTVGANGIYKPTAVVADGVFHLFYTVRSPTDRRLNLLYVTSERWLTLLDRLQ